MLAAVFAVLTVLPMVQFIEIGIVVAVGILIDTFLVRSLLVPALAIDLAGRIWWPNRFAADNTPDNRHHGGQSPGAETPEPAPLSPEKQ